MHIGSTFTIAQQIKNIEVKRYLILYKYTMIKVFAGGIEWNIY